MSERAALPHLAPLANVGYTNWPCTGRWLPKKSRFFLPPTQLLLFNTQTPVSGNRAINISWAVSHKKTVPLVCFAIPQTVFTNSSVDRSTAQPVN
jgi:hypothetical protein